MAIRMTEKKIKLIGSIYLVLCMICGGMFFLLLPTLIYAQSIVSHDYTIQRVQQQLSPANEENNQQQIPPVTNTTGLPEPQMTTKQQQQTGVEPNNNVTGLTTPPRLPQQQLQQQQPNNMTAGPSEMVAPKQKPQQLPQQPANNGTGSSGPQITTELQQQTGVEPNNNVTGLTPQQQQQQQQLSQQPANNGTGSSGPQITTELQQQTGVEPNNNVTTPSITLSNVTSPTNSTAATTNNVTTKENNNNTAATTTIGIQDQRNHNTLQVLRPVEHPVVLGSNNSTKEQQKLVFTIHFNGPVDQKSVVVGKTLIVGNMGGGSASNGNNTSSSKDQTIDSMKNWNGQIEFPDPKTIKFITNRPVSELLPCNGTPQVFALSLIGTDKGNGSIKASNNAGELSARTLDGDSNFIDGGNYLIVFQNPRC
jgi:hypothetical protein